MERLWDARPSKEKKRSIVRTVYEAAFILVAAANLALVFFDASYLWSPPYMRMTMRDVYLRHLPQLVELYDPVKGIEGHRFTVSYVETYQNFKKLYTTETDLNPFQLQQQRNELRAELDEMTRDMINRRSVDSHFYLAKKDGTLELIKNKMRMQYPNDDNSAKDAFAEFFSQENLADAPAEDFAFFDQEIVPLLKENYFRWIGEDGQQKDFFHKIDRWFVFFFLADFLARWVYSVATGRVRKWYLFPVRRGFEIFNLFPPSHSAVFRLLRVIPFYFRLKDNKWLPEDGIMPGIIQSNAQIIAEEISGLVALNILETARVQAEKGMTVSVDSDTIENAEVLLANQMDEVSKKVMPHVEPDISEMVQYSINRAMEPFLLSPVGPVVRLILMNVHGTVKEGLEAAISGPDGTERLARILKKSVHLILTELTDAESQAQLNKDLAKLLASVKIQVAAAIEEGKKNR